MLFITGVVRCNHEGCTAETPARLPITTQGLGMEPVPGWTTPDADTAFCPEHAAEYVPPKRPTRAEVRQHLIDQGAPPDVADVLARDWPEE